MSKEQQQMIDDVYEKYYNSHSYAEKIFQYEGHTIETRRITKDEFVDMVKNDEEYGRRWGLNIKERELTPIERMEYYGRHYLKEDEIIFLDDLLKVDYEGLKIPTKLTTVIYNNKIITSCV